MTQAARGSVGEGGRASEAGAECAELEVPNSLAALAAQGDPVEQHIFCWSTTGIRCRWNVLAGLSVQVHSKLIFVSSVGNFGQDPCHPPFS